MSQAVCHWTKSVWGWVGFCHPTGDSGHVPEGGLGKAATLCFNRLNSILTIKHDQLYSSTIGWLTCQLCFSLLQSWNLEACHVCTCVFNVSKLNSIRGQDFWLPFFNLLSILFFLFMSMFFLYCFVLVTVKYFLSFTVPCRLHTLISKWSVAPLECLCSIL